MERVIIVLLLALSGCDGTSSSAIPPPPEIPTPIDPGPSPAAGRSFELRVTFPPDNDGGALGSLFSFTSADGSATCGAGFISTVGTRVRPNQNDIEFWCWSEGTDVALYFDSVRRPLDVFPQTLIANLSGRVFEHHSSWELLDDDYWANLDGPEDRISAQLLSIRPNGADTWLLGYGRKDCAGVSVYSDAGYHGTMPTADDPSAAVIWHGAVYANYEERVWRADIPAAATDATCLVLPTTLHVDEPLNSYAMYPVANQLFIGGGGRPYTDDPRHPCAPVFATDGAVVEVIELEGCTDLQVTEIYSFVLFDDALYAGTYPDGYLYRIDLASRAAARSELPVLAPETWHDDDGRRYLESQALTIAAGQLLVGMYPWGEVYHKAHHGGWHGYRLFPVPERSDSQTPFGDAATAAYCPDADPVCIEGLGEAEFWSQRVTTLAVFDGRVCAGTGNTFGTAMDTAVHTFLSAEEAEWYGRVHCAPLVNQTLASFSPGAVIELAFHIDEDSVSITQDGVTIASRAHMLDDAALAALAEAGGQLSLGTGKYGPSQATLIEQR